MTNISNSILNKEIDNENLIINDNITNSIDIPNNNNQNSNNKKNDEFKLYSTSSNNLSPPTITPFNSKFFKDIDQSSKDNETNSIIDNIKKSFTRLHSDNNNNNNNNNNNSSNNNEEDEFNIFNGANNNNTSPTKIKLEEIRSNSPTKININNKSIETHDAYYSEINDHGKGSLLATSSSSFVEKVTVKERIRYFFIFIVHNIKTSTPLTWLKLLVIASIITGILLAIFKFKVQNHLDILQKFVQKFGIPLGGLVYVGVFMLLIVFLVPVTIPTMLGGMIFKLWFGILFVWTASMLGGMIAFFLGRYVFRKRIAKKIEKNKKLNAIDQAIGQEGWKIVLLLRLTPIVPESLLNYALSVTRVKFIHYVICSGIGLLPGCSFFVYIGSALTNISEIGNGSHIRGGQIAMYVVSGVLMVFSILFITIIVKRAVNKKLEGESEKGLLDEEESLMNQTDDVLEENL